MEGTIATITMFAGNFAPRNWAYCAGQLLSVSQNTALFSLIGATYGGNGQTTFALPDLQGRAVIGAGKGNGLSEYTLGESTGVENNTVLIANLPNHTHQPSLTVQMPVNGDQNNADSPDAGFPSASGTNIYNTAAGANEFAGPLHTTASVLPAGQGQAMTNKQPYLAINYVICLYGYFPSRS